VVSAIVNAFNAGNLEEVLRHFTDDHVEEFAGAPAPAQGKAALRARIEEVRKAFPDLKIAAKRIFDGGNVWITQLVAHGTHGGEWLGRKPTGKKIGYAMLRWSWAQGGKIQRSFVVTNPATILSQIGALEGEPPHPMPEWPSHPEVIKGPGNPKFVDMAREVYASLSKGDYGAVEKYSHADILMIDHAEGKIHRGLADGRKSFDVFSKAFPDAKFSIEDSFTSGSFVVLRNKVAATHRGALGPIQATGKAVALDGADVIRFEGDKAKELESYANGVQMLQQLGLMPAAPSGDEPPPSDPPPGEEAPETDSPAESEPGDEPPPADEPP